MISLTGTTATDVAPTDEQRPVYSAQERELAQQISRWLTERKLSRSWIARKARLSSSLVSQVLAGKYAAAPGEHLRVMASIIQVETDRIGDGTPGYHQGSVHKLITVVCDRTRKHGNFGVVCGRVGVGKTRTLREYAERHPQTLMIEANPAMTASSLLLEILGLLGGEKPTGMDARFVAVMRALTQTNYLLIVDEAEHLNARAMHYLRRIRDKAGVGVVLSGTEKLHELLKPTVGQFDQIRSRVSMWPKTITAITRDDADEIVREVLRSDLEDGAEVPDDVLDALWAYCAGSARVLTESLLPAIKDYGLGKAPLTAALVDAVAAQVLFMAKRQH